MKIKLIYPSWPKLKEQNEFNLPPHGPVCFAATIPDEHEIEFIDENVEKKELNTECDLVCVSIMLTCQIPRAKEICNFYKKNKIKVICGGIATMLHSEELKTVADSVFLGEAESRFCHVLEDFKNNRLKKEYNFLNDFPDVKDIGIAKRSILNYSNYTYRGMRVVDLVHASRGCKYNCFPCCTPFLGGRKFRPRVIETVVKEIESIDNDKLFIVDNSLAQDKEWEIELFKAIAPLKKKWCSHPIQDDDEVLKYAKEAGAWFVYQAIFDTSDYIKKRIQRYKSYEIAVEGTIILGLDNHTTDYIKKLVDFLLEINLDLAEFTILTPFPHTPIFEKLREENRILHYNWIEYNAGNVVFQPKLMTKIELENMYKYAWEEFYKDEPQKVKMAKLFKKLKE